MSEPDILYPAIFVLIMLLIGLGLTVWEFSRMTKTILPLRTRVRPVAAATPAESGKRVVKASNG